MKSPLFVEQMLFYRKKSFTSLLALALCLFLVSPLFIDSLWGQTRVSKRKHEVGFSVDIFSGAPGTEWEGVLRPNIGAGLFYRTRWPNILYSEAGLMWSFLEGDHTQKAVIVPLYYSLGYRLPLESRLDALVKLGFGSAYLEVQPNNLSGWDPFWLLGCELSILAARFLRIGMRLDYLHLHEKHLDPPQDVKNSPPVPQHVDPRFRGQQSFRIVNGEFIRFGVMFGFLF